MSCLSMCVCANRYEASSRVLCSSEKITLLARFQPPARDKTRWQHRIVISSCLSNVAPRCTHTHTYTHRCCQQFPSFQTPLTPKWDRVCQLGADNPPNPHTLFHSPIKKNIDFFLIKFLKRLLNLFNFSCLRVRVYHQQLQNLNNLKKRNALDHHMSSISTKALQDFKWNTHIHTLTRWTRIVSPPAFRQATSCSSCLQQAGPPLVSPSASSRLFQLSSWESANPTV